MATIEERRKEYIREIFEGWEDRGLMDMVADAYEHGIKEQRKIDIEKACEWLSENIDEYLYNRGGFEEHIPTCGDALFIDFRKAMEE